MFVSRGSIVQWRLKFTFTAAILRVLFHPTTKNFSINRRESIETTAFELRVHIQLGKKKENPLQ
jgi:hypothetical protein